MITLLRHENHFLTEREKKDYFRSGYNGFFKRTGRFAEGDLSPVTCVVYWRAGSQPAFKLELQRVNDHDFAVAVGKDWGDRKWKLSTHRTALSGGAKRSWGLSLQGGSCVHE